MTMGEKIKFLRLEKGLSQEELAALVGFKTRSAINKIETDLRDLKHSQIIQFARVLDSSPHYLLGWTDDPHARAIPQPLPLSEDEQELVDLYRMLNSDGRTAALAAVKGFASLDQYRKKSETVSEVS